MTLYKIPIFFFLSDTMAKNFFFFAIRFVQQLIEATASDHRNTVYASTTWHDMRTLTIQTLHGQETVVGKMCL